jgi:hypothetical protein
MTIWKRVGLATVVSLVYSTTLALFFAAVASGQFDLVTLTLPAVVPVALIGSAVAGLAVMPIAAWSLRTGRANLLHYGPILWLLLAGWIVMTHELYSVVVLAVVGLVGLGFIPPNR